MERTPPLPVELWEQIPLHVQAVLWEVFDRYVRGTVHPITTLWPKALYQLQKRNLRSCVVLGRCSGIVSHF